MNSLAVISSMILLIGIIPTAFAANPTPYLEWDFDIMGIDAMQNPRDPGELLVSINVTYKGTEPLGTSLVYANVTDAEGNKALHFTQIRNLEIGETREWIFDHKIKTDGIHFVDVWLTPPEKPYLNHIFDSGKKQYTVEQNGHERSLEEHVIESDEMLSFMLDVRSQPKWNEIVHAEITLPEDHAFEKITVTNKGKLVEEIPIDSTDIHMKTKGSFQDMQVNLVYQNNLLPMADAQDTMYQYVQFYATAMEFCSELDCIDIDLIRETQDFPIWVLVFPAISVVVLVLVVLKGKPMLDKNNAKYRVREYSSNQDNPESYFSPIQR